MYSTESEADAYRFQVGPYYVFRRNAKVIAEARNDLIASLGPTERRRITDRPWHPIKVRTLRRMMNADANA